MLCQHMSAYVSYINDPRLFKISNRLKHRLFHTLSRLNMIPRREMFRCFWVAAELPWHIPFPIFVFFRALRFLWVFEIFVAGGQDSKIDVGVPLLCKANQETKPSPTSTVEYCRPRVLMPPIENTNSRHTNRNFWSLVQLARLLRPQSENGCGCDANGVAQSFSISIYCGSHAVHDICELWQKKSCNYIPWYPMWVWSFHFRFCGIRIGSCCARRSVQNVAGQNFSHRQPDGARWDSDKGCHVFVLQA